MRALIDRLFPPPPEGRSIAREVVGGCTTFAALSYILFVQPAVLSQAGMDPHAVPVSLKNGIAAGIGLFVTLIGFEYGNLVQLPRPRSCSSETWAIPPRS